MVDITFPLMMLFMGFLSLAWKLKLTERSRILRWLLDAASLAAVVYAVAFFSTGYVLRAPVPEAFVVAVVLLGGAMLIASRFLSVRRSLREPDAKGVHNPL
jgi:peptidoglycan/LPS O-acetylase OafA/YrhL